jgi:hypothetical protein
MNIHVIINTENGAELVLPIEYIILFTTMRISQDKPSFYVAWAGDSDTQWALPEEEYKRIRDLIVKV